MGVPVEIVLQWARLNLNDLILGEILKIVMWNYFDGAVTK